MQWFGRNELAVASDSVVGGVAGGRSGGHVHRLPGGRRHKTRRRRHLLPQKGWWVPKKLHISNHPFSLIISSNPNLIFTIIKSGKAGFERFWYSCTHSRYFYLYTVTINLKNFVAFKCEASFSMYFTIIVPHTLYLFKELNFSILLD